MRAAAVISVLFLLVMSGTGIARESRNDISASVGAATFPDIAETTKDVGGIIGTLGLLRQESRRATPAFTFGYGRFVSDDLRLGLRFVYQKFEVEHFVLDDPWFTSEISYYAFMLRMDYTYLRKEWVHLYSGAGVGLAVVTEEELEQKDTDTEYWFAFHVNALGLRIGRSVAVFAELGLGYEGIASAGVTAAF